MVKLGRDERLIWGEWWGIEDVVLEGAIDLSDLPDELKGRVEILGHLALAEDADDGQESSPAGVQTQIVLNSALAGADTPLLNDNGAHGG